MLHKRSVCLLESAVFIRRIYNGIFILKSCQLLNICETLNHMGIPSDAQEKSTINHFVLFCFKWRDVNYTLTWCAKLSG